MGVGLAAMMLMAVALPAAAARVKLMYAISPREVGAVTQELLDQFMAQHPNIEVEWLKVPGVPGEQHSLYVNQLTARSDTPDVIALDVIWPGEFAANGWVAPLDDYFPPEDQAEFLSGLLHAAEYNGKLYAVPLYINGIHLYYRKDLLAKYGFEPPKTWEELIHQAKVILQGERNPALRGFVSMWAKIEGLFMNYLAFLWGAGGQFFDAEGNVAFNGPEGVKALQTMVDMLYTHKIAPESILTYRPDDARVLFQQGRAVFMVVQDFVWPLITGPDSPVRDKVDFTRVPYFEGHPDAKTTTLGGWLLAINANSRYKGEAAQLIRFLTSHEAQLRMAVVTGSLPARAAVYQDPRLIEAFPQALKQYADFAVGDVRPSVVAGSKYPQLSDIMQVQITAALYRQKTPQQALNDAAARIRALLEE